MSAQDAWLKSIKFILDNWGKIIIVITAIAGYITGGVNYVEKVDKADQIASLTKKIEALEVGPVQVIMPKQASTGISKAQCKTIADKAVATHIKSRLH